VSVKPLHVFIALRDGVKNTKHQRLTALHRESAKADAYEGHTHTYRPIDDDGEKLPSENKNIKIYADKVLDDLVTTVAREWDLRATVEAGDQLAVADLVVPTDDGGTRTVLEAIPATFLLYLARELDDVHKFLTSLPTLDPGVRWQHDPAVAAQVSDPVETHRTSKKMRNHNVWLPTPGNDRHPAQVTTFTEDVVVGYWTKIRRSGALSLERKTELLDRLDALRLAVKEAREMANRTEVPDRQVTRAIFDYLLGDAR
jgi:hypothetical protein